MSECVELCLQIWEEQCVDQCFDGYMGCMDAAKENCLDTMLSCGAAALACASAGSGITVAACVLATASCLENFEDCLDGYDCDDSEDSCVERCIESKEDCCLHCD